MADLAARFTRANLAKALAILLLFLLGACSYMFEVRIDGKDPLSPIFELKSPLLTRQYVMQSVPLGSFSVYLMVEEKWDYKNPMWFFGLEPGRSKEVSHIQYGVVPDGFREISPAKGLVPGQRYLAGGIGAGCQGSVEFSILDENGSYRLESKNRKTL